MPPVALAGPRARTAPPALLAVVLLALLLPASLGAQEEPPPVSEEERAFIIRTLQVRDSLRTLPDSLAADSLAAEGRRRTGVRRRRPSRRGGGEGGAQGITLDSLGSAVAGIEGYTATLYESDSARFNMRRRSLHLFADSAVRAKITRRESGVITADSLIVYEEGRAPLAVYGKPTFTPPDGSPVESRIMYYDLDEGRGTALDADTEVTTDATWFIHGDLPSVASDTVFGTHTNFTTCDLEEPHYHFRSSEVKIIDDEVLVARPVTLYFYDVPVLWLPFMSQSMKQGRRSGILTPEFSVNTIIRTSSNFERRVSNVGYYWAINKFMDAQLSMDWFSGRYVGLEGGFRYHVLRKFLQGDINYKQFWRDEGGRELALNTRHSWEISERTSVKLTADYTTSADFVRRNSFDPREVTRSIRSDAGFRHRFDWGSLNLGANRKQFLTDDRVETTLPTVNLSLNPITLFEAPRSRASWYNNATWSGGGNLTVNHFDRPELPDTAAFTRRSADRRSLRAGFNSSFTVGRFSWAQSANLSRETTFEVPDTATGGVEDLSRATVEWSSSLDFQQRLVGSTTLTPNFRVSGSLLRSDEEEGAESFVAAPIRLSIGAGLKSDIYGFFPAIGPFSAIRHKVSPSFDWSYSPSVTPTELQSQVFGSRSSQTRNELRIGLNQTFEAKLKEDEEDEEDEEAGADTTAADTSRARQGIGSTGSEPRRIERAEAVNVLSVQTSAVAYDFVLADSLGSFVDGFTTTSIRNQFRSDFLRGLSVSMEHDIFESDDEGNRSFSPRLSQLNLSFSLSSTSGLVQALGFGAPEEGEGAGEAAGAPGVGRGGPEPPEEGLRGSSVLPSGRSTGRRSFGTRRGGGRGGSGGWNANVSYSLQRRSPDEPADQMLQWTLAFRPTEHWDLNWRSSYDIAQGEFNDHILSLSRDLHRWEASFDFLQTATGNWSFRFRVALIDQRDLKFDYDQRSTEEEGRSRRRPRGF